MSTKASNVSNKTRHFEEVDMNAQRHCIGESKPRSPLFSFGTRMHSSRMRTGRALTVSGEGGGGWCIPEEIFWGKRNWKKRKKNFGDPQNLENPPENLETPLKIWRTPPENLEEPPPQGVRDVLYYLFANLSACRGGVSLAGGYPSMHWGRPLPPWTEWQTGIKILPWPKLRFGR